MAAGNGLIDLLFILGDIDADVARELRAGQKAPGLVAGLPLIKTAGDLADILVRLGRAILHLHAVVDGAVRGGSKAVAPEIGRNLDAARPMQLRLCAASIQGKNLDTFKREAVRDGVI